MGSPEEQGAAGLQEVHVGEVGGQLQHCAGDKARASPSVWGGSKERAWRLQGGLEVHWHALVDVAALRSAPH